MRPQAIVCLGATDIWKAERVADYKFAEIDGLSLFIIFCAVPLERSSASDVIEVAADDIVGLNAQELN